jgi:hypothetical protein
MNAGDRIRTYTELPQPPPEDGASANSATPAFDHWPGKCKTDRYANQDGLAFEALKQEQPIDQRGSVPGFKCCPRMTWQTTKWELKLQHCDI